MTEFITGSPAETEKLGEALGKRLHGGETVAFTGGLGMGKTVFTRGIAKAFGVNSGVSSPTFTIMKEYDGSLPIYHFDMYRLSSTEDLYSCGFFDYVDGEGILVVEWSENIPEALPGDTVYVRFSRGAHEDERRIRIEGAGY